MPGATGIYFVPANRSKIINRRGRDWERERIGEGEKGKFGEGMRERLGEREEEI